MVDIESATPPNGVFYLRNMNFKGVALAAVCSIGSLSLLNGQMTWQSDVVIEGDLDVGTSTQNGNIRVTGETGNSAGTALSVTGDGGVLFQGTSGTGTMPSVQSGPFFMWYPKKVAFKGGAGSFQDAAVGQASFAYNGLASGLVSVAFGGQATGNYSAALGGGIASGRNSVSIGPGVAGADFSVAIGLSESQGENSGAMSGGAAIGDNSAALTNGAAIGDFSVAFGGGVNSDLSWVNAEGSVAIGGGAQADSFGSVVIGSGRASGSPTVWVDTDPQFVVGYGNPSSPNPNIANKNALVVYKNGNISMPKRQGDILMGEFGLPE